MKVSLNLFDTIEIHLSFLSLMAEKLNFSVFGLWGDAVYNARSISTWKS